MVSLPRNRLAEARDSVLSSASAVGEEAIIRAYTAGGQHVPLPRLDDR